MLPKRLRNGRLQFLAVALFGCSIALLLGLASWRIERERARAAFEELAQQRSSQVTERLQSALHDLVGLHALFASSGDVGRPRFDAFCTPLLAANPAIQALEWVPAVPRAQRAAYEARARAEGHADFSFRVHTAAGMRSAGDSDIYFPVYYVAPYRGNEQALGFDLGSNQQRRDALLRAAASGEMVATSRIDLVQGSGDGYGFLVFDPVESARPGAARGQPTGFVLGVFKIDRLIARVGKAHARELRMAVFDVTEQPAGAPGTVLYPRATPLDLAALRAHALVYEQALEVATRRWLLVAYQPVSPAPWVDASLLALAVLLATALILALMRQTAIARDNEAAREVALRADAAKSDFLAHVSHEMRTPLNGVVGMLDLLLQSGLDAEQQRIARVSQGSALQLLGIINDLLDFAKIEAGRMDIVQRPLDLHALLAGQLEVFRQSADAAGCALDCHIDPALPVCVLGDDLRLRQVLNNLLANAIKFSSGGAEPGRVLLRAIPVGMQGLELSVRDNGIGIDPTTRARLFRPFEQGDPVTTRRYGGTGLGLAITRGLIERMGGSIRVDSRPGAGSTFTVRLPLPPCPGGAPSAPPPTPEPPPGATPPGAGGRSPRIGSAQPAANEAASQRRVLVAEDNETNREVIRLQLRHCGLEVDIASAGAQALDMFRAGRYELLLSDLHMPELDGRALAAAVREHERERGGRRAVILAISAAAGEADVQSALQAGMDGYLTKPIRLDALREALRRWLPGFEAGAAQAGVPPAPAPAPAGGALPTFEPGVLRELVGADPATERMLWGQYLEELERAAQAMHDAARQAQWPRVGDVAHQLKSSSRTVGALALGEICERLERCGKAGDEAAAQRELNAFDAESQAVAQALARELR